MTRLKKKMKNTSEAADTKPPPVAAPVPPSPVFDAVADAGIWNHAPKKKKKGVGKKKKEKKEKKSLWW
jgi:hypothetical protein